VILRARWFGAPPAIGDFLRSGPKAHGAYLVTEVRHASGSHAEFYVLIVAKTPLDMIPRGATVHRWTWDKRKRRKPRS
jgi:hypothetical protein